MLWYLHSSACQITSLLGLGIFLQIMKRSLLLYVPIIYWKFCCGIETMRWRVSQAQHKAVLCIKVYMLRI
jgi:hypothetical protein